MTKKLSVAGMRHVALRVSDLEACEKFYVELLGYEVEWKPDADNVYLSCGVDNLALHRAQVKSEVDRLDHIGIILHTADDVDRWFEFMCDHSVKIEKEPRTHRDGARSFYCYDPDGTLIQMIYHPALAENT